MAKLILLDLFKQLNSKLEQLEQKDDKQMQSLLFVHTSKKYITDNVNRFNKIIEDKRIQAEQNNLKTLNNRSKSKNDLSRGNDLTKSSRSLVKTNNLNKSVTSLANKSKPKDNNLNKSITKNISSNILNKSVNKTLDKNKSVSKMTTQKSNTQLNQTPSTNKSIPKTNISAVKPTTKLNTISNTNNNTSRTGRNVSTNKDAGKKLTPNISNLSHTMNNTNNTNANTTKVKNLKANPSHATINTVNTKKEIKPPINKVSTNTKPVVRQKTPGKTLAHNTAKEDNKSIKTTASSKKRISDLKENLKPNSKSNVVIYPDDKDNNVNNKDDNKTEKEISIKSPKAASEKNANANKETEVNTGNKEDNNNKESNDITESKVDKENKGQDTIENNNQSEKHDDKLETKENKIELKDDKDDNNDKNKDKEHHSTEQNYNTNKETATSDVKDEKKEEQREEFISNSTKQHMFINNSLKNLKANSLSTILDFLIFEEKKILVLCNKSIKESMATKLKETYLIEFNKQLEEWKIKKSSIETKYPDQINKESEVFAFSKGATSALKMLNDMKNSRIFSEPEPKPEVLLVYKAYMQLLHPDKIEHAIKTNNETEFWNFCSKHFIDSFEGKVGDAIIKDTTNMDISLLNTFKASKILGSFASKITPSYFTKICGTTGLFTFILKDLLEWVGANVNDKKPNVPKIYSLANYACDYYSEAIEKFSK